VIDRPDPPPVPTAADTLGWQARLELGLADRAGRTVVAHQRHRGPLTVQRPFYPEGGPCHLYLLHPPGGLVGGDRLELKVTVTTEAHALITTPGATKCYRSAGPRAEQVQHLEVTAGGVLEWFPQENILFPGANLRLVTAVDLAEGARFMGWEIHSLGRPAIGERFAHGCADLHLRLRRAGRPLLLERLWLHGGSGLDGPTGLRGLQVTGTLLASPADAADLAAVRAHPVGAGHAADAGNPRGAPQPGPTETLLWGATLVGDLLIARALAPGTEPLQRLFTALWGILRPRLLGRAACPPRIWAT